MISLFWRPLLLVLAVLSAPADAETQRTAQDAIYTVREGDNLYVIAERYFQRTADYAVVQRLNRIADPRRLPVGQSLRVPRRLLRHEPVTAIVAAARGDIRIVTRGQDRRAEVGAPIREADIIATGANAFITLRLPDGARVSLPSQSRIAVQRLRRTVMTGSVERAFMLFAGRAHATVPPASGAADDFRISSPVAVSAVRGTEFRVRYDPEESRGGAEVLEGVVALSATDRADALDLTAGYGAHATPDAIGARTSLLPAPAFERAGEMQADPQLSFHIVPQTGASRYRLQIAADAGFVDIVSETLSEQPQILVPAVPDGTWFARASAIDPGGLEGMPATYSFRRRLQHVAGQAEARLTDRGPQYLFRWIGEGEGQPRYRFQLMREGADALPVVDLLDLTDDHVTITNLAPGRYSWRVMSIVYEDGAVHSRWSPLEQLIVSATE